MITTQNINLITNDIDGKQIFHVDRQFIVEVHVNFDIISDDISFIHIVTMREAGGCVQCLPRKDDVGCYDRKQSTEIN